MPACCAGWPDVTLDRPKSLQRFQILSPWVGQATMARLALVICRFMECCGTMKLPSNDRARWLAQHIVPHERAIRSWLARRTHDLDIDDVVQEMYARLASVENAESIRNP